MEYHSEYVERMSAALDGALPSHRLEELRAHLEVCPHCRALYEAMEGMGEALRELPRAEPPAQLTDQIMAAVAADRGKAPSAAPRKKQPWGRYLAAAAVLLVVVAGGYGATRLSLGGAAPNTAAAPRNAAAKAAPTEEAPAAGLAAPAEETPAAGLAAPAERNDSVAYSALTSGSGEAISPAAAPEDGGGEPSVSLRMAPAPEEDSLPESLEEKQTDGAQADFEEEEEAMSVTLTVNDTAYSVTLNDSPAARALREALPLTLELEELNGNEKYCYLDFSLPAQPQAVGEIHAGDVMLFGENCLVFFYQDFSTGYSYTPLGRADNPAQLAQALGEGNLTARLEGE